MADECPNCHIPLTGMVCPECRVNWKYLRADGHTAIDVGEYTCPTCGCICTDDAKNDFCPICEARQSAGKKQRCITCFHRSEMKAGMLVEAYCMNGQNCKYEEV